MVSSAIRPTPDIGVLLCMGGGGAPDAVLARLRPTDSSTQNKKKSFITIHILKFKS